MELNLDRKSLTVSFLLCLAITFAIPFSSFLAKINFIVPFLIIVIYQRPLSASLWYAFACGCIFDLISSSSRFGVYPLDFCITLSAIYPLKRYFFADSLSTLPIMTFLFSALATIAMSILLFVIETHSPASLLWFFTDVLMMPAVDAIFSFALFILPAILMGKRIKRGAEYFNS